MSDPFVGEIKMLGFQWAPRQWALCNGGILPIAQNGELYSLLGPMYGGDGRTTFALPDLRGRTPIHRSDPYPQGRSSGKEYLALTMSQMPAHTHQAIATKSEANSTSPTGAVPADPTEDFKGSAFRTSKELKPLNPNTVQTTGGNVYHTNMQPSLVVNFCIALRGLFPSRN